MSTVYTLTGGSPWGFRLLGGQDFRTVLTISKITPGGKADKAGITPGLALLEINGQSTKGMTHLEAQNQVKGAGSSLKLVTENADNSAVSSVTSGVASMSIPSSNSSNKPQSNKTSNAYVKPAQPSTYQLNKPKPPADFLPPPPAEAYTPAVRDDPLPPPPKDMLHPEVKQSTKSTDEDPICEGCKKVIRGPYLSHQGKNWHIDEFVCAAPNCRKPLQNVGFIEKNGDRYCKDCYEKYYADTCARCNNKVIGEIMEALGRKWHSTCFVCTECHEQFKGGTFQVQDGNPYCIADYNRLFSTSCKGCNLIIEAGDHFLEALSAHWHDTCFQCAVCHRDLKNTGFFNAGGKPVCSNHRNARVA